MSSVNYATTTASSGVYGFAYRFTTTANTSSTGQFTITSTTSPEDHIIYIDANGEIVYSDPGEKRSVISWWDGGEE